MAATVYDRERDQPPIEEFSWPVWCQRLALTLQTLAHAETIEEHARHIRHARRILDEYAEALR